MVKLNFFLTAFLLTALQVHSAEKAKSVEEPALKIKKGSVIWVDKKETVNASDMVDGVVYVDKKVDITTTVEEPGQEKGVMYVEPALKIKKGSVMWVDKKDNTITVEEPGHEKGVMYVEPHKKFDVSNATAKDCEAMKANAYYEDDYKACLKATDSKALPAPKLKKGSVMWVDKKDNTITVEEPGHEKGVMYVEPHKKFDVSNATAKDCEAMKVNGYYEDEYKACLKATESLSKFNCEEVTEQYTVCNGVRYVVDLKNNDGLKRDVKKIESYVDPGKKAGSNAISK